MKKILINKIGLGLLTCLVPSVILISCTSKTLKNKSGENQKKLNQVKNKIENKTIGIAYSKDISTPIKLKAEIDRILQETGPNKIGLTSMEFAYISYITPSPSLITNTSTTLTITITVGAGTDQKTTTINVSVIKNNETANERNERIKNEVKAKFANKTISISSLTDVSDNNKMKAEIDRILQETGPNKIGLTSTEFGYISYITPTSITTTATTLPITISIGTGSDKKTETINSRIIKLQETESQRNERIKNEVKFKINGKTISIASSVDVSDSTKMKTEIDRILQETGSGKIGLTTTELGYISYTTPSNITTTATPLSITITVGTGANQKTETININIIKINNNFNYVHNSNITSAWGFFYESKDGTLYSAGKDNPLQYYDVVQKKWISNFRNQS